MTSTLPEIQRPNGKPYRPRKIRTVAWDNDIDRGVIVLGTHDIDRARPYAIGGCRYFYGSNYALAPCQGWYREGLDHGDPAWIYDEIRGAAGVWFTASDDPDEESS